LSGALVAAQRGTLSATLSAQARICRESAGAEMAIKRLCRGKVRIARSVFVGVGD